MKAHLGVAFRPHLKTAKSLDVVRIAMTAHETSRKEMTYARICTTHVRWRRLDIGAYVSLWPEAEAPDLAGSFRLLGLTGRAQR
jgi:hypothetical protein